MDHLTDQQLGDYLDGLLSDLEVARVRRHLEECPLCREEVNRLRWASERLSRDLEHTVISDESPTTDIRPHGSDPRPSWLTRQLQRPIRSGAAALLLLTVSAAASAAIPGSPLHPLGQRFLEAIPGAHDGSGATENHFGLEVRPVSGQLEVHLVRPVAGAVLHVMVVDDSVGGVWSPTGRLRSAPGRIQVHEPGEGTVWVELPRSVDSARILSDGEEVAVWSGSELRLRAPIRGSMEDGYRIDLSPQPP